MNDEIILKSAIDTLRGNLYDVRALKPIPFPIKRFYFIRDIPSSGIARGNHAHKKMEQAIFCLKGSFELYKDDGKKKWKILMNDPSRGELLRRRVWHSMTKFSKDCVILVVASDYYDEKDFIRDYEKFLEYVKRAKK